MLGMRHKDHATARPTRQEPRSRHDTDGQVTAVVHGRHRRTEPAISHPGFRDVFAVAEFRVLWSAQLLSVAGDQLARVALTVLVYDRTKSPLLAAVTYAVTIIPIFAGGVLLAGLADRFPRRTVMISCDLARGALVLVMVIP